MAVGNKVIAQSDEMGALPTLYAATQDIPGAATSAPTASRSSAGTRRSSGATARRQDTDTAERLWTLSEELTGVTVPARAAVA